jgi:hypothetical protein
MKFKFCGLNDCPEWITSEITFITKISSIKLRIICNNLISFIIQKTKSIKDIVKTLEDMNFSEEDANIIVSVLEFIFKNAAKYDVDDLILNTELQQLGLPQENADSIAKVYKNNREILKKVLRLDIFSFNQITSIDYKINYILANNNYNVDSLVFSNPTNEEDEKGYQDLNVKINLNFNLSNGEKFKTTMSKEILGKLINDLETSADNIKKHKQA